jgi:hypothetical protein
MSTCRKSVATVPCRTSGPTRTTTARARSLTPAAAAARCAFRALVGTGWCGRVAIAQAAQGPAPAPAAALPSVHVRRTASVAPSVSMDDLSDSLVGNRDSVTRRRSSLCSHVGGITFRFRFSAPLCAVRPCPFRPTGSLMQSCRVALDLDGRCLMPASFGSLMW